MKKLIGFFLLLIASPVFSQISIEGNVTDANGDIPYMAHVHIGKYNDMKSSISTECSKMGHYTVQVEKPGIYSLRFSAVDHQELSIPLIIDGTEKDVKYNVRLQPNPFKKEPEKITVIGDWNKFAFASSDQMTPVKDSTGRTIYTYQRIATGDTLSYQLMGTVEGGHSVNGMKADYYSYDGGGDYRSVMRTHKGDTVKITYDPSLINYKNPQNPPTVEILNNQFLRLIYNFSSSIDVMHNEVYGASSGGSETTVDPQKYQNMLKMAVSLYKAALQFGDKKAAQFALVLLAKQYDPAQDFGADNAELIMKGIPATSPYWVIAPYDIRTVVGLVDKKTGDAYLQGFKHNPERTVRAIAIADDMEHAAKKGDMEEWRKTYTILKTDYADIPEVKWTVLQHNPDAIVQVGKSVPDFEVALLDGSGKVSNTSMLGKYYMIDFWATWCGPCVGEMPAIHKAYGKFKGKKGFEILSLSMDAAENKIAPFREKKWKMPWMHAFIPGVFNADLAKKFEVSGIPKPILVGPDGKIIAMENDMRGDQLEKTLGKFLGESN